METNDAIGPRQTNTAEISFAPHCFVQVGTRTEYSVRRSALHSGPAVFEDKAAAEAFARRTNSQVNAYEVPIRKRVSWL